eukprot:2095232-Rhodomonas_salina.2
MSSDSNNTLELEHSQSRRVWTVLNILPQGMNISTEIHRQRVWMGEWGTYPDKIATVIHPVSPVAALRGGRRTKRGKPILRITNGFDIV